MCALPLLRSPYDRHLHAGCCISTVGCHSCRLLGKERVDRNTAPLMAGEDFSFIARHGSLPSAQVIMPLM